jgi:hypothetical protein
MDITPEQALKNLHGIAEQVSLNGEGRDVARASTKVLEQVIKERASLLAEKESPKSEKGKK